MSKNMQYTLTIDSDGNAAIGGLKKVEKAIDSVGTKSNTTFSKTRKGVESISKQLQQLQNLASGAFAFSVVKNTLGDVARMSDAWTDVTNRLKLATNGHKELLQAQNAVFKIAQKTRSDLGSTAELYQRLSMNAGQYLKGQQDLANITETVNKAIIVSGTSAAGGAAAITQFSQALASGALRGEEFNSVVEQAPRLAQAIADGMGVSVGQLRGLSQEGKITAEQLVQALRSQKEAIDNDFSKTSLKISDGFTLLSNATQRMAGKFSETLGISAALGGALASLANIAGNITAESMQNLTYAIGGVVASLAGLSLLKTIAGFVQLEMVLGKVSVASGITSVAIKYLTAAFKIATSAVKRFILALLRNPFTLIATAISMVVGYLIYFRNEIHPVAGSVATLRDYAVVTFRAIGSAISWVGDIFSKVWDYIITGFKNISSYIATTFKGVLNFFKNVVNKMIGLWVGSKDAIIAAFKNLPQALKGIMVDATNGVLEAVGHMVKGAADLLNYLPGIDIEVDPKGFRLLKEEANSSSQAVYDAFNKGFNTDYVGEFANYATEKLNDVKDAVAGVVKPWKDLAEIEHKNNASIGEGSESPTLKTLTSQAEQTKAALKSVEEQLKAITNFKQNQTASLEDYAFETSLIGLQAQEVEKLRYEYELWKQAKQTMQGLSQENIKAIENEVATITKARAKLVENRNIAEQNHNNDWLGGMKAGLASVAQSSISAFDLMKNAASSTINTMVDGIVNFTTTGKLNFKEMTLSILKNISQMLVKFAILQAFKLGMSALGIPMPMANGGAFDGGVQFFAKGDIFNSPTAFNHAGGLGVLGEAGPEAIMPLARGPNGSLGVRVYDNKAQKSAVTGQVNNIHINVSVSNGEAKSSAESEAVQGKRLAETLEGAIKSVLVEEMRIGGILNPV